MTTLLDDETRRYLASIGSKGGRRSRRRLTPEQAREMVKVREARRAYRDFHASCFWSYDPEYVITKNDVAWVADRLMREGDRKAWEIGAKLSR